MKDDAQVNYCLGILYLTPELKNVELAKRFLQRAQELGIKIPAQVQQMLDAATSTATPTSTPTAQPTSISSEPPVPLPTGQPVSAWNGIPIMPSALAGNEDKKGYTFSVRATVAEVQDFYNSEMPKIGWSPFAKGTGATGNSIIMYQKDNRTTGFLIVAYGDLAIVIIVQT